MNKDKFESLENLKAIETGVIYKHKQGLKYRVDSVDVNISDNYDEEIHDVTSYENGKKPEIFNIQTHTQSELNKYILYTQLEDGKYPVGKKWVRRKDDFLEHFSRKVKD